MSSIFVNFFKSLFTKSLIKIAAISLVSATSFNHYEYSDKHTMKSVLRKSESKIVLCVFLRSNKAERKVGKDCCADNNFEFID